MLLFLDTADFLRMCLLDVEERLFTEVINIREKIQENFAEVAIDLSGPALESALSRHPEAFSIEGNDLELRRRGGLKKTFTLKVLVGKYPSPGHAETLEGIRKLIGGTATGAL